MLRAFSVRLAHKMRELENEKRYASAVIIQHNFRRYRTNTIVREKVKSRKLILQSIVYMQSLMRQKLRQILVESTRKRSIAAKKIQCIARVYLRMRQQRLRSVDVLTKPRQHFKVLLVVASAANSSCT